MKISDDIVKMWLDGSPVLFNPQVGRHDLFSQILKYKSFVYNFLRMQMLYLGSKCSVFVHKTSNDIDFIFQESTRPTKKVKHFHQKFQRGLKVQFLQNPFQTHHVDELLNNFNNTNNEV